MAIKVLFQTALGDVEDTDVEGIGNLRYDEQGNIYRWVKNIAATALQRDTVCLTKVTSAIANVDEQVYSPDAATGPSTALVHMPAGVPMSGIGASGGSTGRYGWIKVQGVHRVNMMQSSTAVDQEPGCCAISTSAKAATHAWGRPLTGTIDSTAGGTVNFRCVQIAGEVTTVTTLATCVSACVYVRCLP